MFSGTIGGQVVYSTHPFIVVEGKEVSGAFATIADASGFIEKQGSYSGVVYGHNGSDWVIVQDRRINPLITAGFRPARRLRR